MGHVGPQSEKGRFGVPEALKNVLTSSHVIEGLWSRRRPFPASVRDALERVCGFHDEVLRFVE